MMPVVQDALDKLRGTWRFRRTAMGVAWVLCLLGLLGILLIPDRYMASATVFVDTHTGVSAVTEDITIDSGIGSQIERVRQALFEGFGWRELAETAKRAGLVAEDATTDELQAAAGDLRDGIEFSMAGGGRRGDSGGAFGIAYWHEDRQTSLNVVKALLEMFKEASLGGNLESSAEGQEFLVRQIAEKEKVLREAEERLAKFRKEHVGLMPGAQGDYFTRLQAEMEQLDDAQAQLTVAVRRRDELGRQLRGEIPVGGAAGEGASTLIGAGGGETAARIVEAQRALDELLLRYTDRHPDVIQLRQTLKELEQRQKTEIEAIRRGDAGAAARSGLSTNPVYQSLQLQYNQAGVEVAALQANISDHQKRIGSLRQLMDTAPEVEAELTRLDRDYGVVRAQYQAMVERLAAAKLGREAAETGEVKFEVIDPPTVGLEPAFPDRSLIGLGILLGALVIGGAMAFLLNLLHPVFSSLRQLNAVTGMPVLGSVSMTWIERYKSRKRRQVVWLVLAGLLLVGLYVVYASMQLQLAKDLQSWIGG